MSLHPDYHLDAGTHNDAGRFVLEVRVVPPFFSGVDIGHVKLGVRDHNRFRAYLDIRY